MNSNTPLNFKNLQRTNKPLIQKKLKAINKTEYKCKGTCAACWTCDSRNYVVQGNFKKLVVEKALRKAKKTKAFRKRSLTGFESDCWGNVAYYQKSI